MKVGSIGLVTKIDVKYKIKRNQRCCWHEQIGKMDLTITKNRKIVGGTDLGEK